MKNLKNLLLASVMFALVFVPTWSMAQELQTEAMSADSQAVTKFSDIHWDLIDPSFARLVSFDAIGDAWEAQDPVLLTDCALELAEAERILFRNLKSITSDALFEKVIALAIDQNDVKTLDRIIQYGTVAKKDALVASATTARRLAGENRTLLPVLGILVTATDSMEWMRSLAYSIDKARANGNKTFLVDFAKAITEHAELNNLLEKSEVERLKKYAEDSGKMTVESSAEMKEMEDVLDKLAGESRINLSSKSLGINLSWNNPTAPLEKISKEINRGVDRITQAQRTPYALEIVNNSSRSVSVAVMEHYLGDQTETGSTPDYFVCRGWYAIKPNGGERVVSNGKRQVYVHFSNGITPRNYHSKIAMAIKPDGRFEIFRDSYKGNSATFSERAVFKTGGSGNNYQTRSIMSFRQAIEQDGWKAVDFYQIDSGRFTIND